VRAYRLIKIRPLTIFVNCVIIIGADMGNATDGA
jgi:hypothetical protein